jgi:cytochrome c nitrite reductase small subunit
MEPQYAGWVKSSHRNFAGCNDCHTPHDKIGKYVTKARNGFWHSFYFTTGTFPDPIRIRSHNRTITEGACRDCHTSIAESIHAAGPPQFTDASTLRAGSESVACTRCHSEVGHWTN